MTISVAWKSPDTFLILNKNKILIKLVNIKLHSKWILSFHNLLKVYKHTLPTSHNHFNTFAEKQNTRTIKFFILKTELVLTWAK